MQDDRQLAGERDLRFGGAAPLGQTHAHAFTVDHEDTRVEQHIGGFEKAGVDLPLSTPRPQPRKPGQNLLALIRLP